MGHFYVMRCMFAVPGDNVKQMQKVCICLLLFLLGNRVM